MAKEALSEISYWTALDQAELDVLLWELVSCYWEHRKRCLVCGGLWTCAGMTEAVQAMEEWMFKRKLLSRMEALRWVSVA
jgi:hypothetical protein